MNLKDFLTSAHIGTRNDDLSVETSGTKDGGIEDVHTVGRSHNYDTLIGLETVHLDEHLVECLLTLVVATAHSGTTPSGNGIDLVDEDDTGAVLLCLHKQISYTGSTDADKHLDEIGTRDREEGNLGLAGNCLGKECFTCSGRALKEDSFGDPGSEECVLAGLFKEVNDLRKLFLFLNKSGNGLEVEAIRNILDHLGSALAEIHEL